MTFINIALRFHQTRLAGKSTIYRCFSQPQFFRDFPTSHLWLLEGKSAMLFSADSLNPGNPSSDGENLQWSPQNHDFRSSWSPHYLPNDWNQHEFSIVFPSFNPSAPNALPHSALQNETHTSGWNLLRQSQPGPWKMFESLTFEELFSLSRKRTNLNSNQHRFMIYKGKTLWTYGLMMIFVTVPANLPVRVYLVHPAGRSCTMSQFHSSLGPQA